MSLRYILWCSVGTFLLISACIMKLMKLRKERKDSERDWYGDNY